MCSIHKEISFFGVLYLVRSFQLICKKCLPHISSLNSITCQGVDQVGVFKQNLIRFLQFADAGCFFVQMNGQMAFFQGIEVGKQ